LLPPLAGSAGLEVSLVGQEGMAGTAALLGVVASQLDHVVHGSGSALRLGTPELRRELGRSPALRLRLQRYVHVEMHQLAQSTACTRFHVVEERLSRWLLMAQDRARSSELQGTHAFLAHLLGVRRVGITKAAGALHKANLIRYSRGAITILDRKGLEARSCGCYRAGIRTYEQVLG
jgi:CRP-like cAMP-binding protein